MTGVAPRVMAEPSDEHDHPTSHWGCHVPLRSHAERVIISFSRLSIDGPA